jgi:hypothetical protein
MPNRIPTPGIPTPSVRKSSGASKPLTGTAAINEYQKSISPSGMAKTQQQQKTATEKKYPGMFKSPRNTGRGE